MCGRFREALRAAGLAVALAAGMSVQAQPSCQSLLTVGAWNIQYFGKSGKPANVQAPKDIADYIALARVEVLALAEISSFEQAGKAFNPQLDKVVTELDARGGQWVYELYSKRKGSREPSDQWTGLLWNARKVQKVGEAWTIPMTIDPAREAQIAKGFKTDEKVIVWSRTPQAVKFSAGQGLTDFVLVPLHMKSNSGDIKDKTDVNGKGTSLARRYEAELLVAALPSVRERFKDQDIVLLGDTNTRGSGEGASLVYRKAGFRDCNASDAPTHLSTTEGRGAPFDRIYVLLGQPETSEACTALPGERAFKVLMPKQWKSDMSQSAFRERMSDHALVRTTLCIGADDD